MTGGKETETGTNVIVYAIYKLVATRPIRALPETGTTVLASRCNLNTKASRSYNLRINSPQVNYENLIE